jgi:hypothetical protein
MRFLALSLFLAASSAQAADYGIYAGSHIGIGDEGRKESDTFQNRTVGTLDLQAMPGVRYFGNTLLAGILFDFRLLFQVSDADPKKAGDYAGTGFQVGPGFLFDFPLARFLASWDMRARQSVNSPEMSFKGSGFHFLLGYKALPTFSVDLEYVATRYNTVSTALGEADVGPNPVTYHMLGLGASVLF